MERRIDWPLFAALGLAALVGLQLSTMRWFNQQMAPSTERNRR
jgi:hypothetical protein